MNDYPSQVMAENAELARKNTRLIEESEAMLSKFNGGGEATGPAGSRQPRRSFFSFRRCSFFVVPELFAVKL